MRVQALVLVFWVVLAGSRILWGDMQPPKPRGEAVITSDQLEIEDNGARTVFTGHVVLRDPPYVLRADQMVQMKKTGIVDAQGHVEGTWISDTGEKLVGIGRNGQYRPDERTTELWGDARLTRWETAVDTNPVVVTADRFVAHEEQHEVLAHSHVHMTQGPNKWSISDEARLDQQTSTVHLWGSHQVLVHWRDNKGISDFYGDRGTLILQPKQAQLIDHVHGHVIPL